MIKKIKTILTASLFLLLFNLNINSASQEFIYTPQNSVVAVDLHDVVTQFSSKKAYAAFCKLKNKGTFINRVLAYFFTNKKKRACIEKYVLEENINKQQVLEILNPHTPNNAMVEVIKKVKSLGYKVYACSNIGEESYQFMQKTYPDTFELFDGYYVSSACDGYIKKTDPKFFTNAADVIDRSAGFKPKHLVFIDNSGSNLKLAQETDSRFVGLFFKDAKQIQEKLQEIGIIRN